MGNVARKMVKIVRPSFTDVAGIVNIHGYPQFIRPSVRPLMFALTS